MQNSMSYKVLKERSFVFLDLETSGKYPIASDICEIAAVKWKDGHFVDEYHTLINPMKPMSEEVIKIHNITNDMVKDAPAISDKIESFCQFIEGSICVAHHAPFDLGFLSYDIEKHNLNLPVGFALCTSLLARARVQNIINHRLQTLIKYFHIDGGQAHRALDDAKACASVFFNCLQTFNLNIEMSDVLEAQKFDLDWKKFSMNSLREIEPIGHLIKAIEDGKNVRLSYSGGSKPGEFRDLKPISVVRNPEGDFLVADDFKSKRLKRYYISKVSQCNII